jgi:serine/threonine protein kinase
MTDSPRYGKAKYYSRKNDPSEMLMITENWSNTMDQSTSYEEMVNLRKEVSHENLAFTHAVDSQTDNQFFTEFYKHSAAHEYHDHNLYKEIAARRKNGHGNQSLTEPEVWYIANGLVDLDYQLMEDSQNAPHGDIQPKNVMINQEGEMKLIDNVIATNKLAYDKVNFKDEYFAPIAPEYLEDLRVNKVRPENKSLEKQEIFAIGLTSLSAASGNYPEDYYDWDKKVYLKSKVDEDLDNLYGQKSPEQVDFIRRCLDENPDTRWSVNDAQEYLRPYKTLAKKKQLVFNKNVEQTSELGGNDFFDDDGLVHREVVVQTGVQRIEHDGTDIIDGNDFFDDDNLRHEDVVYTDGVNVQSYSGYNNNRVTNSQYY